MPHKPFEEKHVTVVGTAAESQLIQISYPIQKVLLKSGVSYKVTRKLPLIGCEVSLSAKLQMRNKTYSPCHGQPNPPVSKLHRKIKANLRERDYFWPFFSCVVAGQRQRSNGFF